MKFLLKTFALFTILYCTATMLKAQSADSAHCRYTKTSSGYLMVLREADDVIAAIEGLAKQEQLPFANFTGIGFAQEVTFGFYDFKAKKFNPKSFQRVEMGSITGSVAWSDSKPSIHVHGVATDEKFNAYGGHILHLKVGTGSMEIYITASDKKLQRKVEQPLNANVLQVPCVK